MSEGWSRVCEKCGREFGPYLVILGWDSCRCGGHKYSWCRDDHHEQYAAMRGCGHTTFVPPKQEETCDELGHAPRLG